MNADEFLSDAVPSADDFLADTPKQSPIDAGVEAGKGVLQAAFAPLNPEVPKRFTRSLLGIPQEAPSGIAEKFADYGGKNFGPMAFDIAAQPLVAGTGFVTENAISGAAAGTGRYLQTQAQNLGAKFGSGAPTVSQDQAVSDALKEGASYAAGGILTRGAVGAIRGGVSLGKEAFKRGAEVFSGIPAAQMERAIERTSQVLDKAKLDPSAVPIAGRELKNTITEYAQSAGQAYRDAQEKILDQAGDAQKFNFFGDIKSAFDRSLKILTDPDYKGGQDIIAKLEPIYNRASELSNATPKQVYLFQKELSEKLSGEIGANGQYTPVGAVLSQIEKATNQWLPKNVPEIAEMNAKYSAMKTATDELSRIETPDNLASVITSALKNNTETSLAIKDATRNIPGFQAALDKFLDTIAGQKFNPTIASQPRTGLVGGFMKNLGAAGGLFTGGSALGHPAMGATAAAGTLASAGAQALMSSPKFIGGVLQANQAMRPAFNALPSQQVTNPMFNILGGQAPQAYKYLTNPNGK